MKTTTVNRIIHARMLLWSPGFKAVVPLIHEIPYNVKARESFNASSNRLAREPDTLNIPKFLQHSPNSTQIVLNSKG